MPDVKDYKTEDDWMAACVPARIEEGNEQEQAVAACLNIWREREKALEFDMLLTKAETMADGRIRWQARANTGQWDLERERFDKSFWDDVVFNFTRVQEATTKGEDVGMPVPILDIAHYSFRLPAEKRSLAQAGYPIKLWQDGQALMAQGFFCDTPLGRAAAKAAQERPVTERRVSVGVWPDWGRVELTEDGRRIYMGGRNRAYLDHLAMTGRPVDPGTVLEVKSMSDEQRQDALDVLGAEAEALVNEIEDATVKAMPDGVVIKAEEPEPEPEVKAEGEASESGDGEADAEPTPRTITLEQLQDILAKLFESFKSVLDERMAPLEASISQVAELKAAVEALGATETEKVKAAVDGGGDWWSQLVKNSVQRREPVKGEGPKETADTSDPFNRLFGGLKSR
jgi:hypothetical protein